MKRKMTKADLTNPIDNTLTFRTTETEEKEKRRKQTHEGNQSI